MVYGVLEVRISSNRGRMQDVPICRLDMRNAWAMNCTASVAKRLLTLCTAHGGTRSEGTKPALRKEGPSA